MPSILDVHHSAPRKRLPCAARTRRQHTIHHVDPTLHRTDNVIRFPDAHQIPGLVLGQLLRRKIKAAKHRLLPLTNSKSTNRITIKSDGRQRLRTLGSQVLFQTALLDTKQRMPGPIPKRLSRPCRPTHR